MREEKLEDSTCDGTSDHSPQFGCSFASKQSSGPESVSERAQGTRAKCSGSKELKCRELAIKGHSRCCGSMVIMGHSGNIRSPNTAGRIVGIYVGIQID